jgi:hypothetical protein
MTTPHDAQVMAATTYNAAADSYDDPVDSRCQAGSVQGIPPLGSDLRSRIVACALAGRRRRKPGGGRRIRRTRSALSGSLVAPVLATGYRGTIDQLNDDARERVRNANMDYIGGSGIRSVEANVAYAVATKQ